MNELLAMFLRDVLGVKPPEYGIEFDAGRAAEAYNLISETAADGASLREAGNPNLFGFFPRVALRDHTDVEILRPLVQERCADLREALLSGCGQYALGSERLTMGELRDVRDEYLAVLRLSLALDSEHQRWHQEQNEIKDAVERASEVFPESSTPEQNDEALSALRVKLTGEQTPADVENHRPIPAHQYSPEALGYIAGADQQIQDYARDGEKIPAIKRLRELTRCGLKAARDAVELAYPNAFPYPPFSN